MGLLADLNRHFQGKVGILGRHGEGTSLAFLYQVLEVRALGKGQPRESRGTVLTGHQCCVRHLSFPIFGALMLLCFGSIPNLGFENFNKDSATLHFQLVWGRL